MKCLNCNHPSPRLRCSHCKVARYCSRACQNAHWVDYHRKDCSIMFNVQNDPNHAYIVCLYPFESMLIARFFPRSDLLRVHPAMNWQNEICQVVELFQRSLIGFIAMPGYEIRQASCIIDRYYGYLMSAEHEYVTWRGGSPTSDVYVFLWVLKQLDLDAVMPMELLVHIIQYIMGDTLPRRYPSCNILPLRGPNVYVMEELIPPLIDWADN